MIDRRVLHEKMRCERWSGTKLQQYMLPSPAGVMENALDPVKTRFLRLSAGDTHCSCKPRLLHPPPLGSKSQRDCLLYQTRNTDSSDY